MLKACLYDHKLRQREQTSVWFVNMWPSRSKRSCVGLQKTAEPDRTPLYCFPSVTIYTNSFLKTGIPRLARTPGAHRGQRPPRTSGTYGKTRVPAVRPVEKQKSSACVCVRVKNMTQSTRGFLLSFSKMSHLWNVEMSNLLKKTTSAK